MTFLEIVRAERLLSGMQGTGPSTVVDAQGIEELLVRFARDAYVDIQNLREEWDFLVAKDSFNTVVGQTEYSLLNIFGTSTPDFKKYNVDSFIITDANGKKVYLENISRESMEAISMNNTNEKIPSKFAVDEMNAYLILDPIPDNLYTIAFRLWRNPEILLTDTQVPSIPPAFHQLIVYKAIEKLSVYLTSPELFTNYAAETAKMQGQLMRMYIPKKTLMARPLA
jgi:hypothetical protein